MADPLTEIAHGAPEHLRPLWPLRQELKDRLPPKRQPETRLLRLLAALELVECVDGVDGGRAPLLERHVEPVAHAVAGGESERGDGVGGVLGCGLVEDVVEGCVTDDAGEEGEGQGGFGGQVGEGDGTVCWDGLGDAVAEDGVEADVVVVLLGTFLCQSCLWHAWAVGLRGSSTDAEEKGKGARRG